MEQPQKNPDIQGRETKKPLTPKQAAWILAGAGTEYAVYIAAPLLIFLLVIEPKYNPGHRSKLFMVIGLLLCLAVSSMAIGRSIRDFRKKLQ